MTSERDPRTATCQCGQLTATCTGEPRRISVCHCLDCQRRSGGPFAAQARFMNEDVAISGEYRVWTRIADSGTKAEHHFCPQCGSTLWYALADQPDRIAIPIGAFADPAFPPPAFSVYEERQHKWVAILGDHVEHQH